MTREVRPPSVAKAPSALPVKAQGEPMEEITRKKLAMHRNVERQQSAAKPPRGAKQIRESLIHSREETPQSEVKAPKEANPAPKLKVKLLSRKLILKVQFTSQNLNSRTRLS